MQQALLPLRLWEITIKKLILFIYFFYSLNLTSSIEDYIYSDIGSTSNIHGELGLINVPSSRILDEGNLKLHLVNSEPLNSLFIIANPFDWMEVSLRYSDINTAKYSEFKSFSGDQTFKDKSFNLKVRLIEETDRFPELSIGFRDFIGTGRFSSEYIVSSKRVGDFDFSVGLGWGHLASSDGITNPFIDIDDRFINRSFDIGKGGNLEFKRWFTGKKVSSFYGFEYVNKFSGLRFKLDYDSSNPLNFRKESNYSFGLSIPASKFVDISLFRHRGTNLGFGVSYKANYSKPLIKKKELIPNIQFSDQDFILLSSDDKVFAGTINVLLQRFGIFTQSIKIHEASMEIIVDQSKYRNLNVASKRIIQITKEVLRSRDIDHVDIVYQVRGVNIGSMSYPLGKFYSFLENNLSIPELEKSIRYSNFDYKSNKKVLFSGNVNYPSFYWGIRPDLKNHVGAPEAFYSGQIGLLIASGVQIDKNSNLDSSISLSIYENLDQLRLRAYSRLPKVRSDIREYLKEEYALKDLSYSYIFDPVYSKRNLFFGGLKIGYFEEMFGGIGGEFLFRDINKPWYLTANLYWVKQREFRQRLSFRDYETYTGHLNFIWETPLEGVKLILSGGKYLAKDSGITMNLSKSFKSGFTLGFFATKTDISTKEFGEGSFDKGIYFSIPLDLVSSKYRKNNARFIWRNLTKDGGAMLSGTLDLHGFIENTSSNYLNYLNNGYFE